MSDDTIFALASGSGMCGVCIFRISGPQALKTLETLSPKKIFKPRYAHRVKLKNPSDQSDLDDGLALYFPAPNSFTGEDVVELHLHGSLAVQDQIVQFLISCDWLRLAEPGEFTRRAFENNKMDLTQAEGLADLIHAQTRVQAQQALRQMDGALGDLYQDWADRLLKILAHFEAVIDFPDEDLPEKVEEGVRDNVRKLSSEIQTHLSDGRKGELLRDGVHLAIVGPPNAGKSSLLNHLAKREVAIVSDIAGTTRDVIETRLDIAGYPVVIADTAGLRDSDDRIEQVGVQRAQSRARQADLKIVLFDASLSELDPQGLELIDQDTLVVLNKSDKAKADLPEKIDEQTPIIISAKTGEGMDVFFQKLEKAVAIRCAPGQSANLTRERHRQALSECQDALMRFDQIDLPELAAEDLRLAVRCLGKITGRIDVEDILDVVFGDFCIGK